MKQINLLLTVCMFGFLMSCSTTLQISDIDPMPNIDLDKKNKSIALVLGEGIKDKFATVSASGGKGWTIDGWKDSLKIGFDNSYKEYFRVLPEKTIADFVLLIRRADFEWASFAVAANGISVAAHVQVTYQARLLSNDGNTIKKSSGTVSAKKSISSRRQLKGNIQSAIESMYEKITADCFEQP